MKREDFERLRKLISEVNWNKELEDLNIDKAWNVEEADLKCIQDLWTKKERIIRDMVVKWEMHHGLTKVDHAKVVSFFMRWLIFDKKIK